MKSNRKYLTDSLVFTGELIEKYRLVKYPLQEDSENYVLEELNELFVRGAKYLIERFETQLLEAIKALPDNSQYMVGEKLQIPKNFVPHEVLHSYMINQLNHFFKNEIGGYTNFEEFHAETENEETAFFINLNSLIIEYHSKKVKENKEPQKLVLKLSEEYYDLKQKPDLLKKLDGGKKNLYVKHLKNSRNYLRDKVLTGNKNSKEKLIIDGNEILRIKPFFEGLIWEKGINEEEFLSYWRLGRKTKYLPIKNINAFIFLLFSYYDNIKNIEVSEAFDIKTLNQKKTKIRRNTQSSKNVIKLMGQPKYSLNKLNK